MASVTADEDSLLLSLDRRALIALIESKPAVARGVIERMAHYVRDLAAELSQLRRQTES